MNPSKYRVLHTKCEKCICTSNLLVHHLDRNRKNNTIENFQVLCCSCHAKIHTRIKNIKRMRWLYVSHPDQLEFNFKY